MLSDDAINTIADDVRTKPLAEVGRHVMPLIAHINELEGHICQTCRHWLAHNAADEVAPRGECLYHGSAGAATKVEGHGAAVEGVAHLTPFDWSCKGWEARPDRPVLPDWPQYQGRVL